MPEPNGIQKWCYMYSIGRAAYTLVRMSLMSDVNHVHWFGYCLIVYLVVVPLLSLYTICCCIFNGRLKMQSLIDLGDRFIYHDSHEKTKFWKFCPNFWSIILLICCFFWRPFIKNQLPKLNDPIHFKILNINQITVKLAVLSTANTDFSKFCLTYSFNFHSNVAFTVWFLISFGIELCLICLTKFADFFDDVVEFCFVYFVGVATVVAVVIRLANSS